ncbi:MAG: proline--tRNA ligase [Spirochaetaceae bacterium]|nr:proline--tRNA ligase [Spirochaetaceae bacterium]
MRYSRLFGKTKKETQTELFQDSYSLLFKAGFARPLGQGLYCFLPMGLRVLRNIKRVISEEMENLGGSEIQVPLVNPADLWEESGRNKTLGTSLIHFKDIRNSEMVLAPTHEEAVVSLVKQAIHSYRDFPIFLYQFQTKFRNEFRTRGGMIRTREFEMSDSYSFHRSFSDLNNFYPKVFAAFERIFTKCTVAYISAESGVGIMNGSKAYEFLTIDPQGKETVVLCDNCGYRAREEVAQAIKSNHTDRLKALEKVEVGNLKTMKKVSAALNISLDGLGKTMLYTSSEGLIMAVVRADYDVSREKLSRYLSITDVKPASKEELDQAGLTAGFMSPINPPGKIITVIDDTVVNSSNLAMASNEKGIYYLNVNFGRDFDCFHVTDISRIKQGDLCLSCGAELKEISALELGSLFKVDDYFAEKMHLQFQNEDGTKQHPWMGSYRIGLGRLIMAIVDANHDDRGIVWPYNLAPYKFFLMGIGKSKTINRYVDEIEEVLGPDVLVDDRNESISKKFRDAELIGIPLRIVVSSRYIEDEQIELCDRATRKKWLVHKNDLKMEIEKWRNTFGN